MADLAGLVTHLLACGVKYSTSFDEQEKKTVVRNALEPAIQKVKLTELSDVITAPSEGKVLIVVSNHVSDLDTALITKRLPKECVTAFFAYDQLQKMPLVGPIISEQTVLVGKSTDKANICSQVASMLDRGCNTFVIYPEGCHMQKKYYEKSVLFQRGIGVTTPLQNVCWPRRGAMSALLETVGDRLEAIADITLVYPGYDTRESEFSSIRYPSLLHSYLFETPAVLMHVMLLHPVCCSDEGWLEKLWILKDKMVEELNSIN